MKLNGEDVWLPERIERFWDNVAGEPRLQHKYFSLFHAKNIVNFAKIFGLGEGDILDYGCGLGFLSQELVRQGFSTTALDYSQSNIQKTNERLKGFPNWHGAFSPKSLGINNKYNWVFSIETFEHLRDEWIDDYFINIYNRLSSGGMLFLSTPYNENLDEELVICPCCETKFHRWGHLRSVSPSNLSALLKFYGFKIELCRNIDLIIAGCLYKYNRFRIMKIITMINPTIPIDILKNIRIKLINRSMKEMKEKNNLILIAKKNE
jgi:SAM-dependent methyltransferase